MNDYNSSPIFKTLAFPSHPIPDVDSTLRDFESR